MDRNLSFGYLDYIKSDAWKERAAKRKDLDGNRCARCGAKERLHTHHINYRNFRNEDVEKDLITLCADCHEYVHQNKDYVISGLMAAKLILDTDFTCKGFYDFLRKLGIENGYRKMCGSVEEHLKVIAVPVPEQEQGAIIIPFYDGYFPEKDMKKMCEWRGVEFYEEKNSATKIYYWALEDGGYIADIMDGVESP